jgi:hypothetical protein
MVLCRLYAKVHNCSVFCQFGFSSMEGGGEGVVRMYGGGGKGVLSNVSCHVISLSV